MANSTFSQVYQEIENHPSNAWAKTKGYTPIFTASETARVVIIGQAPGKKAQDTSLPWNDKSGETLRKWLSVSDDEFYDSSKIALLPMDFYYPGKGKRGDLPPRKEFAAVWHPKLFNRMPNVALTLLIGHYAQVYYLSERRQKNLTETVYEYKNYLPAFFPIVHPSPLNFRWLSKNPWFEESVVPELKRLVRRVLEE